MHLQRGGFKQQQQQQHVWRNVLRQQQWRGGFHVLPGHQFQHHKQQRGFFDVKLHAVIVGRGNLGGDFILQRRDLCRRVFVWRVFGWRLFRCGHVFLRGGNVIGSNVIIRNAAFLCDGVIKFRRVNQRVILVKQRCGKPVPSGGGQLLRLSTHRRMEPAH